MKDEIVNHLWFDSQSHAAAEFYTSLFPGSSIDSKTIIKNTPSGDCEIVEFTLANRSFLGISAGPAFKFTPAISLMVHFKPDQKEALDKLWAGLIEGGSTMMDLGEYPFSPHYGWLQDKYGLSWQLYLQNEGDEARQMILPSLLYVGDVAGKAEEATEHYMSVFENSARLSIHRYPAGREPDKEGSVMYTDFTLADLQFAAMDSAHAHQFKFNEAFSLLVQCEDQEEIDKFWTALSHHPEKEQCGWCMDKYGVSWQITSRLMQEMLSKGSPEQKNRVTQAFLKMKKIDIAKIEEAYHG